MKTRQQKSVEAVERARISWPRSHKKHQGYSEDEYLNLFRSRKDRSKAEVEQWEKERQERGFRGAP